MSRYGWRPEKATDATPSMDGILSVRFHTVASRTCELLTPAGPRPTQSIEVRTTNRDAVSECPASLAPHSFDFDE